MSNIYYKKFMLQYPRGVFVLFSIFALLMVSASTFLGIFVLYLTVGLHYSDAQAYTLFATFISLLAMLGVAGGYFGDRIIGYSSAVICGFSLMAIGLLLIGFFGKVLIFSSLSFYVVGVSLVMPNGMRLLSQLYLQGDLRKSAAFTMVYTGFNVGALIGFIISSYLATDVSFIFAFKCAALAPLAAIIIFCFNHNCFGASKHKLLLKNLVLFLCAFLIIYLIILLLHYSALARIIIIIVSLVLFIGLIVAAIKTCRTNKRLSQRVLLFCFLFVGGVTFWAFYRLEPSMLILFFTRNVNRIAFGHTFPASLFLGLNPFYMIILGFIVPLDG